MGTLSRHVRTPQAPQKINPPRLVEAGARRVASRAHIRVLLRQFLGRNGFPLSRFDLSGSGIGAAEADLLWWAAQDPHTAQTDRAAVDDEQYPGD